MPSRHARHVCLLLLAVSVAAALLASAARLRLEAENRTVALILDYDQVRHLAAVGGLTTRELLERMKRVGVTHVAVSEQTLCSALESGEVSRVPVRPQDARGVLAPTASFTGSPGTIERLHRSLTRRPGSGQRTATVVSESSLTARLNVAVVNPADILDLGIGYSPDSVHEVNRAGLALVVRPLAEGNQWGRAATEALTLAEERNAHLVVFEGTAVLGYPDGIPQVADEFARGKLLFGYVEFGKQYGDMALATRLPNNLVRVHSIGESEMLGMNVPRAVDRFALAVRERNIRACYIRLFEPSGPEPAASAEAYVARLAERLRSYGFQLGQPQPYRDLGLSPWLRRLALLGPLAAFALCLIELLGCRSRPVLVGLGLALVLALLGTFAALTPTAKLGALLSALALPTLAVGLHRPPSALASARWSALGKGLLLFAGTSGVSLVGGLLIVGCLADTRFLVKLDQFAGVKVAHLLPLLAVLVLQVGWDLGAREPREAESPLATLLRGWRLGAEGVVKYWHAALLLVCAAALALLILRSGNESGVGVSSLELHFRSVLDRIFGVRPRTKEVLIGHPLFVLGLARACAGKRAGRWVLLSLGAVGQVSLVNTLCHLHTPLLVSLARTLHGAWFGALLGVVLYAVVEAAEAWWRRARPRIVPASLDSA